MKKEKETRGAVIAYALNLIDLSCTLWALHGGAVELNPLMRSVPFMVCYLSLIHI